MTISLPIDTVRLVNTATKKGGFATKSEFIRSLLRQYFMGEEQLASFVPRPLPEISADLSKTGVYNQKFVESVVKGLSKSSIYAS